MPKAQALNLALDRLPIAIEPLEAERAAARQVRA